MTNQQQNHIGNALIFMCRYSFPRKTSADMACNSALKSLWEFVPKCQRDIILHEISLEKDLYENDPILWNDFLKWIEKDNYSRK